MKSCPNCSFTFDDETYNFCLHDGSYLTSWEEMEVETIVSLNHSALTEPIIAINIAQQYPYVKNDLELYEVTRGLWRLSKQRAERADYAFAVFRGEIKEVYQISYWENARFDSNDFWINRKREQGVEIDPSINEGRYQFVGQIASFSIRSKYIGTQLPQKHGQNPIRYFNC